MFPTPRERFSLDSSRYVIRSAPKVNVFEIGVEGVDIGD